MQQQELLSGFRAVSDSFTTLLPQLLAAAALALTGWLLGRIVSWLLRRLVQGLIAQLSKRPALGSALEGSGASTQVPAVIAGFGFWLVFVFFLATAMETLGLPVVTASLSRIAYYLPNVLVALITVIAGIVAGRVAGSAAARAVAATGTTLGATVATTVRGTVILVAAVVAMEQVGIRADLLVLVIALVIGATLAGAGLAFGLGARTAMSNIIASYYVSQTYRVGQKIRVGGIDGEIVQTTPTAVFVASQHGRVMIPAKHFSEEASILLTEQ